MKIAVEGCCHGELDKIYETLQYLEQVNNIKVDLLLICGDFQAVRNKDDLESMAVPKKYQKLNTFYKYYSGEKVAPVLTIFIGGNHEASNYMQELPYGGWVAENIYYMGYANVIQVKGLRIGGLSGIYKSRDYNKGHYEHAPYTEDTKRSVYHIRSLEVFRLKQLSRPLDIFMSHDWPTDIAKYGQLSSLFKRKPFLEAEVRNGSLGSPPAAELLHKLQPSHWFAAHLHVKYAAVVQHSEGKCTKFLSLDKCLPRRRFLQVLDFPDKEDGPVKISLDPEWLCVLKTTNHLLNLNRVGVYMPGPGGADRYNFEVSEKDMEDIKKVFGDDMTLPENFETTAPTLKEREFKPHSPPVLVNPQTALLCTMLDVTDPNAVHLGITSYDTIAKSLQVNADDVDIDEDAVDTDDDAPSDVNSSLDTSYISSSMDMSDSFSDSQHKTLAMDFSANSSALSDEVNDDDEEFQAILAAQRQNSVQSGGTVEMDNDKLVLEKSASGSDSEVKTSLTSSSKTESSEDEFAATCPAQQHNSNRLTVESGNSDKAVGHTADAVDISCSDLDSASQDSQDETGRVQTLQPHQTAKTCHELSLPAEDSLNSPASKRSSPDVLSKVLTSSGKKIKRRNVSMYSSSGLEEDNG